VLLGVHPCLGAEAPQAHKTWCFGVESLSGRSLRHGHREPHFAARLVAAGVSMWVTEIGVRIVTCSGLKKAPFRGVSVLVVTNGHGGAPGLLTRSSHASCHILVATYAMPSHAGHATRVTKGSCDASLAVVHGAG